MSGKTVEELLEEQNSLLKEQNKLLAQQSATANGMSHRDDMRGVARRWDDAHPIVRFFAKNPYGQWK